MFVVAFDRFGDFLAGFHRHGAFIDDHPIIGQNASDLACDLLDVAKIDISIWLLRRGDGDKDDLRIINAFLNAAAKPQPVCRDISMDDFFEARLVDRHLPSLQRFDLRASLSTQMTL